VADLGFANMSFQNKQSIKHPPLSMRMKVLEVYYKKLSESDHIDALVLYKNTMGGLYHRFNPWLRQRFYTRKSFMPKEEEKYDDYN
jgi:hypothetical protein